MQPTRQEQIANIESYLIENKLGSYSPKFKEMMILTYNYLGLNIELNKFKTTKK